MGIVGCLVAAALTIGAFRLFAIFANWSGAIPLVFLLGMFFAHVWPHFRVPYDGTIAVVDSDFRGIPLAIMDDQGANWFTLTVENTTDEPYDASYAICSFRGPVIYTPNYGFIDQLPSKGAIYIGERRILVTMLSVQDTKFDPHDSAYSHIVDAAYRPWGVGTPKANDQRVVYVSTTQMDMMTDADKMEWCDIGSDLRQLAARRNLTLGAHGVIAGQRVTWTDRRYDFPTSRLVPNLPSEEAIAIVAGLTASD